MFRIVWFQFYIFCVRRQECNIIGLPSQLLQNCLKIYVIKSEMESKIISPKSVVVDFMLISNNQNIATLKDNLYLFF